MMYDDDLLRSKKPSPLAKRFAWLGTGLLSAAASVPLLLKSIANLIDGIVNKDKVTLKEAGRYFVSAIVFPIAGVIDSIVGIISPQIASKPIITQIFPARSYFKQYQNDCRAGKIKEPKLPDQTRFKSISSGKFMVDLVDIPCEDVTTSSTRIVFCGQGRLKPKS